MAYPLHIKAIFAEESDSEIIFAFNGVITQDLIVSLGETIRCELSLYTNCKLVNRVFAVFIEIAQNVMHYSDEKFYFDDKSYGKGQLILMKNPMGYEIVASNRVTSSQKKFLSERSHLVNNLNCEELKDLYIKTRRQKEIDSAKGAGLGFIDIARKSGLPLEVEFEDLNDFYYIYRLKAMVNGT